MSNKKLISNSVKVMILIILGKIFALVRDALIAAKFGATYITDVYNVALGIVYLLTTVSYGLTTTFIPIHTENIEKEHRKSRNDFVNNIINLSTIATIVITILMIIFAKYIIFIFGHGFGNNEQVFNMSIKVTRIMLLSLIFVTLQSIVAGVLQCHKQFLEPSAMALASNVVYIIYLVFLTNKYGIEGFAVATVIGFMVQFLINIPKYKKLGYKYKWNFNFRDAKALKMFKLTIPVVISTSVVQLNVFVNRAFATNIHSGAVTILDCANKINTLAYEVFAIGIAMIVYPTLSELAAKNDKKEYSKALLKSINTIMIIMIPAAIAIAVLREPLITVIFKRGAFDNNAATLTANTLLFYCPAMIAYGVRDILNRAFYSVKDTKTPMINSFIGIAINVFINIFIVKYMGVSGLALSTTISAIISVVLMAISLNRKMNIDLGYLCKTFIKIIACSVIMGIVLFYINKIIMMKIGAGLYPSLLSLGISFIIGVVIYFFSLYFMKVKEIIDIARNYIKFI